MYARTEERRGKVGAAAGVIEREEAWGLLQKAWEQDEVEIGVMRMEWDGSMYLGRYLGAGGERRGWLGGVGRVGWPG